MTKARVRRGKKAFHSSWINHGKKGDRICDSDDENLSDSDYEVDDSPTVQSLEDIQQIRIVKVLKQLGCYKYLRRNVGGYQRSVEYCTQVINHTSKFLAHVGGEDMANFAILRASVIIELMRVIMTSLHATVICKYCNHLSLNGFKPSKFKYINKHYYYFTYNSQFYRRNSYQLPWLHNPGVRLGKFVAKLPTNFSRAFQRVL
jgi:hypothetical protein